LNPQESGADAHGFHQARHAISLDSFCIRELDRKTYRIDLAAIYAGDDWYIVGNQPQQTLGFPSDIAVDEDEIGCIRSEELRQDLVAGLHHQAVLDRELGAKSNIGLLQGNL